MAHLPPSIPKNHLRHAFYIFALAVVLLAGIGAVQEHVPLLNTHLRDFSLLADLRPEEILTPEPPTEPLDSLLTAADSLDAEPPGPYVGDEHLGPFCAALETTRRSTTTTRIAYFGDSIIEGDFVTMSLREFLQETFGGYGVGLVGITNQTAGFRSSIHHNFSDTWRQVSFLEPDSARFAFGILGDYHTAPQAWVQYRASQQSERTAEFKRARLFHGPVRSGRYASLSVRTDTDRARLTLAGTAPVNVTRLTNEPTTLLYASLSTSGDVPLYGVSFDDTTGVYLDNFAVRGSTGLPLSTLPLSVLRGFQQHLGYDLIVVQVGLNVLGQKVAPDFVWYEEAFTEIIQHLQEGFPGAAVLVVGIGDRGVRRRGELMTDPEVPLVRDAQRNAAEKAGAVFLDLFEAMGGEGSIVRWSEARPRLVRLDYTHFNEVGAERVARLIEHFLLGTCSDLGYRIPPPPPLPELPTADA